MFVFGVNELWLQKKVGVFIKDIFSGLFIDEWKKIYVDNCKDVEQVEIVLVFFIVVFFVKDEVEFCVMCSLFKVCVVFLILYFFDEMFNIFD